MRGFQSVHNTTLFLVPSPPFSRTLRWAPGNSCQKVVDSLPKCRGTSLEICLQPLFVEFLTAVTSLATAIAPLHCTTALQSGCVGIIMWENVVFKESGEIFTWRNLGALAVQCVREAV